MALAGCPNRDTVLIINADDDTEADTSVVVDPDTEPDTEADTEPDTEADTEADTEPGTDADTEPDTEAGFAETMTFDTFEYNGYDNYPIHLDACTTTIGNCCSGTTTQEQMDRYCQDNGYTAATDWVVETQPSVGCYCWGACTNFEWYGTCCSGQDDRNFVIEVTCGRN